ncbi:MAG: hypothetical protein HC798_04570 [Polaribacter sp.]|nr:hypothetical protein [Polaribacter sp.]
MGKGKGQQEFSLPDLIEQQKGLSEKMKDGMDSKSKDGKEKGKEKGNQKGDNNAKGNQKDGKDTNSNGEDGQVFEIYKEQNKLRQQLEKALKDVNIGKAGELEEAKKVLKTMEELENEIIEKGLNPQTLQKCNC